VPARDRDPAVKAMKTKTILRYPEDRWPLAYTLMVLAVQMISQSTFGRLFFAIAILASGIQQLVTRGLACGRHERDFLRAPTGGAFP
jgi:hypothetical protein